MLRTKRQGCPNSSRCMVFTQTRLKWTSCMCVSATSMSQPDDGASVPSVGSWHLPGRSDFKGEDASGKADATEPATERGISQRRGFGSSEPPFHTRNSWAGGPFPKARSVQAGGPWWQAHPPAPPHLTRGIFSTDSPGLGAPTIPRGTPQG